MFPAEDGWCTHPEADSVPNPAYGSSGMGT
jgi:hypothetical protein